MPLRSIILDTQNHRGVRSGVAVTGSSAECLLGPRFLVMRGSEKPVLRALGQKKSLLSFLVIFHFLMLVKAVFVVNFIEKLNI